MGVYLEDLTYKEILPILARTGKLIDTRKIIEIDLVRCEECKHHDEDGWGYGNCQRPSVDYLRTADEDFCSYRERRADETQP